jgi:L-alanine-DL-glutamate epimerase and related enzymes of enolase superfamily
MKISYELFDLKRKYPFTISGHTFTSETTVYVKLEHEGVIGYGEAAPGYYFNETMDDFLRLITTLDLNAFTDPFAIDEILAYTDNHAVGLTSAKAAVDIALHDLCGKLSGKPCYSFFGVDPTTMPVTTFTIGIDTPDMIRKKVKEAIGFTRLKVKLGGPNDKEIVDAIRSVSDLPLTIDANQGWTEREQALDMIHWLNERNTIFIEQPMPRDKWDDHAWLTEKSPLPIVADEAMQRLHDVDKIKGAYHGLNIKMVKCTGMNEGFKIIQKARQLGLKVMIGCMGESSVSILGAASIAPLCDWVDLDSCWLMANNPYNDPELKDGKIVLSDQPGLGLVKK